MDKEAAGPERRLGGGGGVKMILAELPGGTSRAHYQGKSHFEPRSSAAV